MSVITEVISKPSRVLSDVVLVHPAVKGFNGSTNGFCSKPHGVPVVCTSVLLIGYKDGVA